MNWVTWSLLGTGLYVLVKKPASAAEVKPPSAVTINVNPTPAPKPAVVAPAPKTVVKTTTVDGRKYKITRAGLGIYRVELSSNPNVFYELDQNGPLRTSEDSAELTQLKSDLSRFPSTLFK
jgi:hypothetical protein